MVYGSLQEELGRQGVIFTDTDTALREHPDLLREYFAKIIPPEDNKFAALNSAVWSGGSFIYVPKGVKIEFPLQAYFRINAENMGQFERTLIIVDEGAEVHYVEGCTAPMYSTESLHSAVVEIVVKRHARCRYTTIQNWANNIYNLVTKRAMAYEGALMEWIDGNLGSHLTMKYPAVYMMEPGARGEVLSIAFASAGQHQDAGAKMVHCAAHLEPDHLQVDLEKRRPVELSRPGQNPAGGPQVEVERRLRRPDPGSAKPQRHLPLYRDRRAGRRRRARGQRLADRRGATVLPDEPRTVGARGQHDDRQRLHRAVGQRAADGIRRGNEPADRVADGRHGRLRRRQAGLSSLQSSPKHCPPGGRGPFDGAEPAGFFDRVLLFMSQTSTVLGFGQEAFDAFLASRSEPAWVRQMRLDAWQTFQQLPLPSRREEEWMRTDIRLLRLDRFGFLPEPPAGVSLPEGLLTRGVDLAGQTLALDSHAVGARLDAGLARQGVVFDSLEGALVEHGDLLKPYLQARVVNPAADKFAALHAAWWSGGTVLYVPRGVTIDRPLHMLSALTPGATDLGHALIVLEDGAEATVLAETASTEPDAPGLHLGGIELIVKPGARLRYVNLQNWSTGVWHFAHQCGQVERDGRLQWTIAALGSRLAKVNQHVALVGEGADTQVNGAMFTEGKQHLSYHTLQHHRAPHCHSDLLYKAALQDASHTVWRGMIKVDPGAKRPTATSATTTCCSVSRPGAIRSRAWKSRPTMSAARTVRRPVGWTTRWCSTARPGA